MVTKLHRAFRCKNYSSQMIWFLMGVYIINRHYLAAWRYIISLLVSKNRVCLMVTHDPRPTTIRQTLKNIVLVWSAPQDIFFIKRREIPYLRADMQYPLCVASYSSVKKGFKGLFIVAYLIRLVYEGLTSMGWCILRLSAKISALLRLLVIFFQLWLTKELKINFFCFKELNIKKSVFFVSSKQNKGLRIISGYTEAILFEKF